MVIYIAYLTASTAANFLAITYSLYLCFLKQGTAMVVKDGKRML